MIVQENQTASTSRWARPAHGCSGASSGPTSTPNATNMTSKAIPVVSVEVARLRHLGSAAIRRDVTTSPTPMLRKKLAPFTRCRPVGS